MGFERKERGRACLRQEKLQRQAIPRLVGEGSHGLAICTTTRAQGVFMLLVTTHKGLAASVRLFAQQQLHTLRNSISISISNTNTGSSATTMLCYSRWMKNKEKERKGKEREMEQFGTWPPARSARVRMIDSKPSAVVPPSHNSNSS